MMFSIFLVIYSLVLLELQSNLMFLGLASHVSFLFFSDISHPNKNQEIGNILYLYNFYMLKESYLFFFDQKYAVFLYDVKGAKALETTAWKIQNRTWDVNNSKIKFWLRF